MEKQSENSTNRPDTSKNGLMKKHLPIAPNEERKKRTSSILSRFKSLDTEKENETV